jgi:hypothetical protein
MPSSVSSAGTVFENWNRRLHYYLGLYFLLFLWLFSLTGLLLNHGQWKLSQAANQRRETRYAQAIQSPKGNTDLERARDLVGQLHLVGEIDLPATPHPPGRFDFTVNRPRDASQVRVDFSQHRADIQHFDNGSWAIFRILHTFSGSRFNVAGSQRDWIVTTVWVLAMDALAAGMIVMVAGSYYMWYRLKRNHTPGIIALVAGFISCAIFFAGFVRP